MLRKFRLPQYPKSAYKKYVPLSILGRGADGQVFLCLPRSDFVNTIETAIPTVALRSKLVAVKVMEHVLPPQFPLDGCNDPSSPWYKETYDSNWSMNILEQLNALPKVDSTGSAAPLLTSVSSEILAVKRLRDLEGLATEPCKNIPSIMDVVLDNYPWTSWYSMELVEGCNLRKLTDQGANIPAWLLAHVFIEVVQGLKWLRRAGMTHGDLHPYNTMLTRRISTTPRVLLIDFGRTTDLRRDGELSDCKELMSIIKKLVQQGQREDGDWIREVDGDDMEKKIQFLGAVERAVKEAAGEKTGTLLCGVWEACGGLAQRIKEDSRKGVPDQVHREMREAAVSDGQLEELVRKGGEEVFLVPDHS